MPKLIRFAAGHILAVHSSHAALGPYVVHPWFSVMFLLWFVGVSVSVGMITEKLYAVCSFYVIFRRGKP